MTAATTADLYLRLSDARHEDQLEGREAKLRTHAAELGWTVYRVIIENDLATKNGNGSKPRPASAWKRRKITTPSGRVELRTIRPGFRSMLDDLAAGRASAVLAEDLDRVLRQPRDGEDLLDQVELSGATCKSLTGSLTLTEGGTEPERFLARIMAATASKSSADTARRVAASRERLAGQSYQGGRRPYGFRPDPSAPKYRKRLLVVDSEAAVLRQAADDILDRGISLKAVARDLRERGVLTVSGTAWSAKTLREVLIKPAVGGRAVGKGEDGRRLLVPAPWDPILDPDRWERLRDKLTDPSRRTNLARANEPRWLVSGFATCGVCGGRTRVAGGRNRAAAYVGAGCCHVRRSAVAVDNHIAELAVRRLGLPDIAEGDTLKPPPRPGIDARKLRTEARRLRDRKAAQMRLHAAGDIDDADLAAGMRAIRDRLARIDAQLAASDEADPLAEFRQGRPAGVVWDGLSVARRRAVVQTLMAGIVINRAGRRGQGFDPDTLEVTPAPGA